jgi:predicted lipoprotein with Yx(FWY)xxD motif
MKQMSERRITTHQFPIGRIAAAAEALGGLSVSAFVVSTAGAATGTVNKVVVSTAKSAKFGKILVSGKTLYTLKPSKTACTVACMKVWAALVLPTGAAKATAGSGVSASKLGSVIRAGGVHQVTYSGKALYWFSGDSGPGQVNGNVTDEWGKWSAVGTATSKTSGFGSTPTTTGSGELGSRARLRAERWLCRLS